jgi:hypothetical protein
LYRKIGVNLEERAGGVKQKAESTRVQNADPESTGHGFSGIKKAMHEKTLHSELDCQGRLIQVDVLKAMIGNGDSRGAKTRGAWMLYRRKR